MWILLYVAPGLWLAIIGQQPGPLSEVSWLLWAAFGASLLLAFWRLEWLKRRELALRKGPRVTVLGGKRRGGGS